MKMVKNLGEKMEQIFILYRFLPYFSIKIQWCGKLIFLMCLGLADWEFCCFGISIFGEKKPWKRWRRLEKEGDGFGKISTGMWSVYETKEKGGEFGLI